MFMGIYHKYILELEVVKHASQSIETIDYTKLHMGSLYVSRVVIIEQDTTAD